MRERREWKPGRLIACINHFLDRGYVVSLLMDLCHCSVNHSIHLQTVYYLEAGLLCTERDIEQIILLLSIFFFPLLLYSLAGILGLHRIAKQAVFRLLLVVLPLSSLGKWALTQLGGDSINL